MRISTTVRHCELDPEDRLYMEQRLEKLSRFARDIREAHLILTAENYRHTAELTLKLNRHEIVSREEANLARTAISTAADHLERQLRKLKDRRLEHKRGDRRRATDAMTYPGEVEGEEGREDFGESAREE